MTTISRVRLNWTGFVGAPGISTFYTLDPPAFMASMRASLADLSGHFPIDVHLNFDAFGDELDDTTGMITGAWAAAAPAQVIGTYNAAYAAPAGLAVTLQTLGIVNGHHVRGRTFMVPLSGDSYEGDGSLTSGTVTQFLADFTAVVTALGPNWLVWSRPFTPVAPATKPVARLGSSWAVTACSVADKVVILRSRRD